MLQKLGVQDRYIKYNNLHKCQHTLILHGPSEDLCRLYITARDQEKLCRLIVPKSWVRVFSILGKPDRSERPT